MRALITSQMPQPLISSHWGLGFNIWILWGHRHSSSFKIVICLLLSCKSSLYILNTRSLSILDLQIFFPILWVAPLLCGQWNFTFSLSPTWLFLLLLPVPLVSLPKNHCQIQCHKAFTLYFYLRVLFSVLHLGPWSVKNFFFYMMLAEGLTPLFCICMSIFPRITCWKACSSPIEWSRDFCQKSLDHICYSLFLGCIFYSTDLYVCIYASITLFWLL